jgi:hypothetical protein
MTTPAIHKASAPERLQTTLNKLDNVHSARGNAGKSIDRSVQFVDTCYVVARFAM